jgi:hypothetical protein
MLEGAAQFSRRKDGFTVGRGLARRFGSEPCSSLAGIRNALSLPVGQKNKSSESLTSTNMGKTKLGLQELNIGDKVQTGQRVAASLQSNPAFNDAGNLLTELTQATDSLDAAQKDAAAKRQASQLATTLLDQKAAEWDKVMGRVGSFIDLKSGGDTAIIQSAGLDVRAPRSPVGELPAPGNLTVEAGEREGAMNLKWEPVRGAASYEVQQSTDAATGWTHVSTCTQSRMTVTGLGIGRRYSFRVRAVGAAGPSPWTGEAYKMAA